MTLQTLADRISNLEPTTNEQERLVGLLPHEAAAVVAALRELEAWHLIADQKMDRIDEKPSATKILPVSVNRWKQATEARAATDLALSKLEAP